MNTDKEKWHFVFCDNKVIAAFTDQNDALEYASHMCFPGLWDVVSGEIPVNCIKNKEKNENSI